MRFNGSLLARSMRWLGPALLWLVWTAFTVANPGAALGNSASSFMMLVTVACWLTIGVGNVDDDGHRELLAAASGSPARLHRTRAATAFAVATSFGLVSTIAGIVVAGNPEHSISQTRIVIASLLLELTATAAGVGLGTLLHRPVVRHAGATLLVVVAGLIGLILLPPVEHVLRQFNDDRTGGLGVLTAVTIAAALLAVGAGGVLADRRN